MGLKKYGADKFYEDAFTVNYEDTSQERIESALRSKDIKHYRMKTIRSGNIIECEIYPVWNTRNGQRSKKAKESRLSQKNLNNKNAIKQLIRLLNENFTEEDIWGTVTYGKSQLPSSPEQASREIQNYFRRLAYHNKLDGGEPLKFIHVTEYEEDPQKGKKRVHHHYVTNFRDRDKAEKLWNGGSRTQTRRLQPDENGFEGLARYILKDPRGTKRYVCSRNLRKPTITVSDHRVSRLMGRKLADNTDIAPEFFAKIYPKYRFTSINTYLSDYSSGAYIYVKMWRPPERRQK